MNDLILAALGGLCIFFSCIHLLPEKPSRFWQSIVFLWILSSSCILNQHLGQYYAFITVTMALFLIYFSTSLRWLNLSCALFGYLFTISLNYFYIWIVQFFTHMNLEQIYQNSSAILLFSFIYFVICFFSTLLLGYFLNTKLKISTFLISEELNKGIFFVTILLTVFFIFNFSYGDSVGYSYGAVAFNGILFLMLFISVTVLMWFLYHTMQQKQQARNMLHQYEHLQTYTEEVEKLYGSMRGFKHEYVNLLSTLSGYIEENDMPHLKEYFYCQILPISQTFSESDTRLGTLSQVEILELKSLLSSKLIYAIELDIKVELELPDTIQDIPMTQVDLARVMGIFLDNAIDAALNSSGKLLQLCMFQHKDCITIILRNSSVPPAVALSKLSDWGISSKGEGRGIGLYNAKNILSHYPHVLWDTEFQNSFFTQKLTIYHEERTTYDTDLRM